MIVTETVAQISSGATRTGAKTVLSKQIYVAASPRARRLGQTGARKHSRGGLRWPKLVCALPSAFPRVKVGPPSGPLCVARADW